MDSNGRSMVWDIFIFYIFRHCQGLPWSDGYGKFSEKESVSCSVVSNSLWPHGMYLARLLCPWDFPGKNTGSGYHFLLQGDLPDPGIKSTSLASSVLADGFFTSNAATVGAGQQPSPREVWDIFFSSQRKGQSQKGLQNCFSGTSLAVQWLRFYASTAGRHRIPAKIPHAARCEK